MVKLVPNDEYNAVGEWSQMFLPEEALYDRREWFKHNQHEKRIVAVITKAEYDLKNGGTSAEERIDYLEDEVIELQRRLFIYTGIDDCD